jgi:type 1 glutamine amidotransferase
MRLGALAALAVATLLGAPPGAAGSQQPRATSGADRVLVLSRTEGFRHESIAAGIAMLRALAPGRGLQVVATEDPARLTDRALRRYRAVVFLQTTGDVLDAPQERALRRFVRRGGGWLGVHAAADTERGWPFYADGLLGARFTSHPPIQRATVVVEDRRHPATRHLPRRWTREDEWYSFRASPRRSVNVVASLDERTYDPGGLRMGDHPIAWWQRAGRGRAFYTALGHTTASYAEPAFRRHVLGALAWVSRRG